MNAELLKMVVCPKCKSSLTQFSETSLVCGACRLSYPIRDGIPVLLIDEAVSVKS